MSNLFTKYAIVFAFILLISLQTVSAKVFTPGDDFIKNNITKSSYSLDTSASAIVLYEKVYFTLTVSDGPNVVHRYLRRIIKVLTDEGKRYADVTEGANYSQYLYAYSPKPIGTTYNWVDGKIVETKLDDREAKIQLENNNRQILKFSMPEVRAGSIIEYEYSIDEPKGYVFGYWNFQDDIPKLYSEVEVTSSNGFYLAFTQSLHHFDKFDDNQNIADSTIPDTYCTSFTTSGSTDHKRWVRKNIEAIKTEPFVTNIYNYNEKIFFQDKYARYNLGVNANTEWKDIDDSYYQNNFFIKELKRPHPNLTKLVSQVTANIYDSLKLAKTIYRYVRDSFAINTMEYKPNQSLSNILETRKGSIMKINEVLIGMLKEVGLSAAPVLLNTTSNIRMNETRPIPALINRMVVQTTIGGKKYFLDPLANLNSFGVLMPDCYNGYARVLGEDSGYAVDLNPDLLVDKDVTTVNTLNADPDNYLLKCKHYYGNATAPQKRRNWITDSTHVRNEIIQTFPAGFELVDYTVENLNNPDTVLALTYTVKVPWVSNTLYMSVFMQQFYSSNPFVTMERKYPIEFPNAREDFFIMNMQIPKGYICTDSVVSAEYQFDEKTGIKYIAIYDKDSNTLGINAHYSLRETYFDATDYKPLKSFFDDLISLQQTAYIFKRK